ncbi:hypothetical protein TcWFU_004031 [Taenia crassiceps]|uniref:Uncharacterized protein n=1 Tax=Taenia crassiceps TaxID=6207 RepID=A0ABR4QLA0_9CEST
MSILSASDKYAPCVVPTVPSPKELLSPNWGLSRPREYVKLLEGLVSSWRIFATKREVHVLDDTPSYLTSSNPETVTAKNLTELEENAAKELSYSPPDSPTLSSSPPSSAAASTEAILIPRNIEKNAIVALNAIEKHVPTFSRITCTRWRAFTSTKPTFQRMTESCSRRDWAYQRIGLEHGFKTVA